MTRTRSRPCVRLAIGLGMLGAAIVVPRAGMAQEEPLGPRTTADGPTRDAVATTARTTLETRPVTPRLMPRYLAFQEDFADDFGPRVSDRLDSLLGLQTRLEERWGDTTLYQWLERGLALYARIQASTRVQRKGFDIKVKTDDMAGGKLGVRMSRPLGSGATEPSE